MFINPNGPNLCRELTSYSRGAAVRNTLALNALFNRTAILFSALCSFIFVSFYSPAMPHLSPLVRMTRIPALAATLLLSLAALGQHQDYKRNLGFGLVLGDPSAISLKKFHNSTEAMQYTIGYSLAEQNLGISLGVDYLHHNYSTITALHGSIPLYVGAGAYLGMYKTLSAGVRVPLGVAYEFNELPLDVFLQAAPGVALLPSPGLSLSFGLGARIYLDLKPPAPAGSATRSFKQL